MIKKTYEELYSCFIFGEGKKDKTFLAALIDLPKFKWHTVNWVFTCGNSSGGSAVDVLEKCHRESSSYNFDLVLCFIDLDQLKRNFPKDWREKRKKLEDRYENIEIIWQIDNAEDEYKKVLGEMKGKHRLNQEAKRRITKFINSEFWKRILKPIHEKEKYLNQKKKV